jgi:hypothetical protein
MQKQEFFDDDGSLLPKWREKMQIINNYLALYYQRYPELAKTPEGWEMHDAIRCIDDAYLADELDGAHIARIFAAYRQLQSIVRQLEYGIALADARKP